MSEYLSKRAWAAKVGAGERTVQTWLNNGLVPGAFRGTLPGTQVEAWHIPADAPRPDTTPAHKLRTITVHDDDGPAATPAAPPVPRGVGPVVVAPESPTWPGRPQLFYSVAEVAAMAGPHVSARRVVAMLRSGLIAGSKDGDDGQWIVPRCELRRLWGE